MKKNNALTVFILFMLFNLNSTAQQVSKEEAQKRANSFFQKVQSSSKRFMSSATSSESELAYTASQFGEVHFYVFNKPEGGWVMIGGDEICKEVLAYSEEGTFSYPDAAPNIKNWLQGYEQEISQAIKEKGNNLTIPQIRKATQETAAGKDIDAMIKTTWDQESPYYLKCPKTKGVHCATGCVATALSQVMNYWQWPKVGIGEKSYYDKEGCRQTLSTKFSDHQYQWDLMAITASGFKTTAQKDAVSQLMYDVGVSVSMEYNPYTDGGSGAYSEEIPEAMYNYFCYAKPRLLYRDDFSKSKWIEIIYRELSEGRPIIYGGEDKGNAGGHEFICDGYQFKNDNHYFHFNWGWSGYEDAFYTLEATGSSYQFTQYQDAIIGLQPRSGKPCTVLLADDNTVLIQSEDSPGINLPEHSIEGYTIEGWTEQDLSETTSTKPEIVENPFLAYKDTVVLYPVYSFKQYNSGIVKTDTLLYEDFSSAKSGNSTKTNSMSKEWDGNDNFQKSSISKVYQAGGALRLGTSSNSGAITSKTISVEPNTNLCLSLDCKGWTTVESPIYVFFSNSQDHYEIQFNNTMSDGFVRAQIAFTSSTDNFQLTISSPNGRAFIDNVLIATEDINNRQLFFTPNTFFSAILGSKTNQWSTFFAPFDVTLEKGMAAYDVEVNNGKATLEKVADGEGEIIPANTPVLVFCKNPIEKTVTGKFSSAKPSIPSKYLIGSLSIIINNGFKPADKGYVNYILSSDKSLLEKVDDKSELQANRAYFTFPEATDITTLFDNGSTSVRTISSKSAKVEERIFNLQGQEIKNISRHGVYIINGKKILK